MTRSDSLHAVVNDEHNISHSHWSCPRIKGQTQWVQIEDHDGWLCGTCTHTHDLTELVGQRRLQAA